MNAPANSNNSNNNRLLARRPLIMRLRIHHTTTFTYDQPISEAYTEMRLKPLSANGQHCVTFNLQAEPRGDVLQYTDRYGNDVRHFDVLQPHQQMTVIAASEVLTPDTFISDAEPLSPLDEYDFLNATGYAPLSPTLQAFAAPHAVPDNPLATARALLHAVHGALRYEKGATDVTTHAEAALALGRGVCQDYTHILLSACRAVRLPARYVSGYIYNDGQTVATHAWCDIYIAGQGWVSFDPTHNRAQNNHYVRLAVGRDYADVPPTRGVYKGKAKEQLDVQVRVEAL